MSKILLVDGDAVWSSYCEGELRREGYAVRIARDGYEALEEILLEAPDVVVTEIRLTGIDGLDLMARILDRHPRMPVILNSACSSYRDNFMSWSADAYLSKSVDTIPLRAKIRELLEARGLPMPTGPDRDLVPLQATRRA